MRTSVWSVIALAGTAIAATPDQWATRSIYQVITDRFARTNGSTADCTITNYCGGTYAGIVEKLDYIQNMGFTAIQISPVSHNIENETIYGDAFHGYWVDNLGVLNEHFGTADDLKNLSAELHARNMYLMVDVVIADMAYDVGDGNLTATTPIDYDLLQPFNGPQYYHTPCNITDWSNVTDYQTCMLAVEGVATLDLKTEDPTVLSMLQDYVHGLVTNYSLDGIRIDGAKQVNYGFFKPFINSAGVYSMSEVYIGDASMCSYQNLTQMGMENYAVYYDAISAFTAGNMDGLVKSIAAANAACPQPQWLTNFVENQDLTRFASYVPDIALAQNALAFIVLADGIPKVYYGQEQHATGNYSPYNREAFWEISDYDTSAPMYNLTATLNSIRNHAISVDNRYVSNLSIPLYHDNSTMAVRKGPEGVQIISVYSNQGSKGGSYELSVPNAAVPGTEFTDIINCTTASANSAGNLTVQMGAGLPKVYFPTHNLNGSGLCGSASGNTTNNSGSTNSSSSGGKKKGAASGQLQSNLSTLGLCGLFTLIIFALL